MARGLTAALCAMLVACASPQDHASKLLTYRQYAELRHSTPYVLEFTNGDGALLIYGARHTFDPADPQIEDIKREWDRFQPTVAYNEGGNPPAEATVEAAVQRYGETGLVRHLAAWHRVPVATFEPFRAAEAEALLEKYTAEQVKVFLALRAYLTFRRGKNKETADEFMGSVLADPRGVQGAPATVKELEATYARLFPGHKDWRQVPDEWFDPTKNIQYTNEVSAASGHVRDRHILNVLVSRARRGDRVFAVIGASHVPVMEPALIAALGSPERKRNGAQES